MLWQYQNALSLLACQTWILSVKGNGFENDNSMWQLHLGNEELCYT